MKKTPRVSKVRHSIGSLGLVQVTPAEVRVERLELRMNPKVPFPHRHDFFQLCFITAGSGWHEIDFHRRVVKPRQLYLMKPAQVHSWELSSNTTGYLVEFGFEPLKNRLNTATDLLTQLLSSEDFFQFRPEQFVIITQILGLMEREFEARSTLYELAIQSHLTTLIILLLRQSKLSKAPAKGFDMAARFNELVDVNFRSQHRVEFYAEQLKLTSKALTMRIARALKTSPRALIQGRLLLEAKRLLLLSDKSVLEIAAELGIDDANYFSRLFKSKFALTPTEFRSRARDGVS